MAPVSIPAFHTTARLCALALLTAAAAADEPATFQGLGGIFVHPQTGTVQSRASGVSSDGSTIVGTSTDELGRVRPFRWRSGLGLAALRDPASGEPPAYTDTGGLSADGTAAVGTVWSPSSCPTAALWTGLAPPIVLPSAGCTSAAFAASGNAGIVVGEVYTPAAALAMKWEAGADTAVMLQTLTGFREATARAISDDGSIIAGSCYGTPGSRALIWENASTVPTGLDYLPNTERNKSGRATAVSPDGSHVVGDSSSAAAGDGGLEGFLFNTFTHTLIGLGPAPGGHQTLPADVCDRGEVVVGSTYLRTPPFTQTAFIWTRADGLRDLKSFLQAAHGLDLTGWHLSVASGISADGSVIIGVGDGPRGPEAWRATIPPIAPPCIADFNRDGGVDGGDVETFIRAWEDADPSADANQDGSIDGSDVESFFIPWEAGGCD